MFSIFLFDRYTSGGILVCPSPRRPPSDMQLDHIAYNSALGWRPVIQAVCKAFPKARVKVIEFGALTAEPILQLSEVSGWQDLSHLEKNTEYSTAPSQSTI